MIGEVEDGEEMHKKKKKKKNFVQNVGQVQLATQKKMQYPYLS